MGDTLVLYDMAIESVFVVYMRQYNGKSKLDVYDANQQKRRENNYILWVPIS